MAYGYITSVNEYKKQLKDLNRNYEGRKVWEDLYGAVGLSKQRAESQLVQDYNSSILNAYKSAYKQQSDIYRSALGQGYKDALASELDLALSQAYDSYRQNYLSQKNQLESNTQEANSAITSELETQAENTKLYQDSFYSYLDDLWNRAQGTGKYEDVGEDETLKDLFTNDILWNRYTTKVGENTYLMDSSELYGQLYDKNRMITDRGLDFYDQMFNSLGVVEGKDYSFHRYLSDVNPELYEWSIANNPYDYTTAGTNMGTFKTLMGLDSMDNEYKFIERNGGLTKDEVQTYVNKFADRFSKLSSSGEHEDSESDLELFKDAALDISKFVESLELDAKRKEAITSKINAYISQISEDNLDNTARWAAVSEASKAWNNYADDGVITQSVNTAMTFLGETFFPTKSNSKKTRNENIQSNKNYLAKLESDYLDLLTYISYEVTKK